MVKENTFFIHNFMQMSHFSNLVIQLKPEVLSFPDVCEQLLIFCPLDADNGIFKLDSGRNLTFAGKL